MLRETKRKREFQESNGNAKEAKAWRSSPFSVPVAKKSVSELVATLQRWENDVGDQSPDSLLQPKDFW